MIQRAFKLEGEIAIFLIKRNENANLSYLVYIFKLSYLINSISTNATTDSKYGSLQSEQNYLYLTFARCGIAPFALF